MTPADADARRAALALDQNLIVVAPAGSGKTGLLVQRFLGALTTVERPEEVVAITFTNKAAAEIRERIGTLLQRAAAGTAPDNDYDAAQLRLAEQVLQRDREHGWDLNSNPTRLRTSTIDGFNSRLAADLPLLSGLGGQTQVSDDPRVLYQLALIRLFDQILGHDASDEVHEAAATWLRGAGNRLDRLLPPLAAMLAQREHWAARVFDAEPDDDALLAELHDALQRALFDALGAEDAQQLLEILGAGAHHSKALAWAATLTQWPAFGAAEVDIHRALAQALLTGQGTMRKPRGINKTCGFPPESPAKAPFVAFMTRQQDNDTLEAAAWAVAEAPPPYFPAPLRALRQQLGVLLKQALVEFRLTMAERGETDYSEIALAAINALRPDDSYGDTLLAADKHIRHLLVDEMQDTSAAQIRLLEQLTQGWQPGDGHSLFLVGDPQQSIYAFRNAQVALFMRLWQSQTLGGVELQRARLTVNFRSDPALICWFNESFQACFPARDDLYTGEVAYTPAAAPTTASEGAAADADAAVHAFTDSTDEAVAVAERVAELVAAGASSIAILARARAHLPGILGALRERDLRYACQDIDALQALPAVRDILACARALWHPEDRLHWAILLRAPWVGLAWADLVALTTGRRKLPWPQRLRETPPEALSAEGRARVARLLAALDAIDLDRNCPPLAERVQRLWAQLGGPACGDSDDLADARRALQLLRTHAGALGFDDLPAFERAVARLYASPAEGAVQVLTIHKSKGLEFDHVLLVGCGRGSGHEDRDLLRIATTPHGHLLVPLPAAHWPEDDAADATALYKYAQKLHTATRRNEALRLLYVAATRARHSLHCYATRTRPKKAVFSRPANTFAGALWGRFEPVFNHLRPAPANPQATHLEPPRNTRLPLDFAGSIAPFDDALYRPREHRTLHPSEAVLSVRQAKQDETDSVYARLVGTLYHQAMQHIAENGIAAWQAQSTGHPAALASGLRRLGLPEPEVETAVARVLELVHRSLASRHGQWLLAPKPWARAEYAISGYVDGEWVAAAIDRCFTDDDGQLWIIDYKTRAAALPADAQPAYIEACRAQYATQLGAYARLLALERGFSGPVRTALYLVEPDQLVEVETQTPAD